MKAQQVCVRILGGVLLSAALVLSPPASGGGGEEHVVDVMFVLDITASMQFAITGVEAGMESTLKQLRDKGLNPQVGLTVFRDELRRIPNDKVAGIEADPFMFLFAGKAFTGKAKDYREVVSKIKADGGGDIPENSLEAIILAAPAKGRSSAISRVMILITDAPPHDKGTLKKRLTKTRTALSANKWDHLYLITQPAQRPIYENLWDKSAGVTGFWSDIGDQKTAFNRVMDAIANQLAKDVFQKVKGVK